MIPINIILLFLSFLVFVPHFLTKLDGAELLYNSDLVQPYLIVSDLVKDPSSLFAWYLSPAPYVFPDWFLSASVMALPLSAGWLPLVYGAIILTLYCVAGGAVLVTCDAISRCGLSLASWAMAAALCGAGVMVMFLPMPEAISRGLFTTLSAPYIHTGAALITLVASAFFLRALQDARSTYVRALMGLTFAASFSDALFFAWFVCPAVITALLLAWSKRQNADIRLALLIAASGIVGLAFDPLLRGMSHVPSGASFDKTLEVFQESLNTSISHADVPMLLMMLLVLAVMTRGAFLTINAIRRRVPTSSESMEILLAGICATGVLAPIVTSQVFDMGSWRYFLILTLIPLVWLTYYTIRMLIFFQKRWVLNSVPIILGLYCLVYAAPSFYAAKAIAGPTPMQTCIKAAGRTAGLGEYWSAKKLIFSSERRIHVAQLNKNGYRYLWNYNKRWFKKRADNGNTLNLNFIIAAGMDKDNLRLQYGQPNNIVDCDGEELWLYDKQLSVIRTRNRRK